MSPLLAVECATGSVARARADLVVVAVFREERPLRGSTGEVDWRLCGRLSGLVAGGRLAGRAGEAALLPAGEGLRAPLVVALGLGPIGAFGARGHEVLAREAVRRGIELGARVIALPFLAAEWREPPLGRCAAALIAGAARALADADAELLLRVVCPREEAERAEEALRRARPRALPESVRLQLPDPLPARVTRPARASQPAP